MSFMGEVTPMAALRNGPWLALTGNGRCASSRFIASVTIQGRSSIDTPAGPQQGISYFYKSFTLLVSALRLLAADLPR